MKKRLSNKAKCLDCGDTIQSKFNHDFVTCKCYSETTGIFVDGGLSCPRFGFHSYDKIQDMSEYEGEDDPIPFAPKAKKSPLMNFKRVPKIKWPPDEQDLTSVYKNADFLVQVYEEKDGAIRLSINRTQYTFDMMGRPVWDDRITWDELQAIKFALGYDKYWGMEIYPPKEKEVNVANIRHLFLVLEKPIFAWGKE